MGADLIIAVLATKQGATLDWEQVEPALASMRLEDLNHGLDYATGETYETHAEARKEVRAIFKRLRELVEELHDPNAYGPRDLTTLTVRDLKLYVSGGMSWGDMPTDASTVLDHASWFEPVLKAVGFVTDWWAVEGANET